MMLTRRHLLGVAASGAAATVLADPRLEALAATRKRAPLARGGTFPQGVMSGDPSAQGITLWTRVGELARPLSSVRVEVARDPAFRRIVARRTVPCAAEADHTVKVRVTGLAPDERYWYRFATRDRHSPVGRTQTALGPDSLRPVKIGVFSCQDWVSGYYGAYRKFVGDDVDLVVCLGDYIYERIFYPVHRPDTVGANKDGEARTLAEYRDKYKLYRSDADLQEMHRLLPFVAMWDDHEVEDNYAGGDPESDDYDRPRTLAGWRAFHEYQPNLRFRDSNRTYRRLKLGALAELFFTDQRSYRDDQPCGDAFLQPCGDSAALRDYLGRPQLNWLKRRLSYSGAAWKVVGNQLMIMPFDAAPGVPVVQDSWEGYQAERNELLSHIRADDISDVSFITGDIHTFFAGQVLERGRSGPAVATEFVAGSTTSPGTSETVAATTGTPLPPSVVAVLTDQLPLMNAWFTYAETVSHGVATARLDREQMLVDYWASRDVTTREGSAELRKLQSFAVRRGDPAVHLT